MPTAVATLSRPDAPSFETCDGLPIHRLDGLTRHLRRFATDPGHYFHPTCPDPVLVSRLGELVESFQPDIVHAHGWILNSCLALRLPAPTALVTTLHDYGLVCSKKTAIHRDVDVACTGPGVRKCLTCAGDYYGGLKGSALALGLHASRRKLSRVATFLPISSAVQTRCLPGVDPARICAIPAFIDDAVCAPSYRAARPSYLPSGPFIAFVGALGEHKGVGLLLEAHRRMRMAVPLVLLGSLRADSGAYLGTSERPVIVRTDVPHSEIMACLHAATAAVAPSRWQEPLGLVAVEAMAAGTPVVVTDVGALPEVIVHEETGLVVPPNDPIALAAAIDAIVGNPHLGQRYGAAGMRRARSFTASAIVPRVISAYEHSLAVVAA